MAAGSGRFSELCCLPTRPSDNLEGVRGLSNTLWWGTWETPGTSSDLLARAAWGGVEPILPDSSTVPRTSLGTGLRATSRDCGGMASRLLLPSHISEHWL